MKIRDFEIVNRVIEGDEYEYEEITIDELVEREGLSKSERSELIKHRMAINMHFMIAEETYDKCLETLEDIRHDPRLKSMSAIVLLSLKKKGRGEGFSPLSPDKYNYLVQFCLDNNISFGMDSCGAKKFLDVVKDSPKYEDFMVVVEPCESTNFSQYIDVEGNFYPCSFCEGVDGWKKGIPVKTCNDFIKDIWYNGRVVKFRKNLNSNCNNCHKARECPIYGI